MKHILILRENALGALTSKESSFELRDWDVSDLESLDPTDNFGINIRLYLKDQRVIQIEPCYNTFTAKTWLTDRGRQFYDSIYKNLKEKPKIKIDENSLKKRFSFKYNSNKKAEKNSLKELPESTHTKTEKSASASQNENNYDWAPFLETVAVTLYLTEFAYAIKKKTVSKYLTIFFENTGLQDISALKFLASKFSFLKIRSAEDTSLNNDFEACYQLNNSINYLQKLEKSTLCLLIGCNPRYEGVSLNLSLKKRENKGNFRCINMNSQFNLTYDTKYNNTSLKILKNIGTGNALLSQELKTFKFPILIFNTNFYKRVDKKLANVFVKYLNYTNVFKNSWLGLNFINSSLFENGKNYLNQLQPTKPEDLKNCSLLHVMGVGVNNTKFLKKIVTVLLKKNLKKTDVIKTLMYTSAFKKTDSFLLKNTSTTSEHCHLPTPNFFESDETFINAEGVFCQNLKVLNSGNAKKIWQIYRKLFDFIKTELVLIKNPKENHLEVGDLMSQNNFKNYLNFLFFASITLKNNFSNTYLSNKNRTFLFTPKSNKHFRFKKFKTWDTKINYWICDFYTGAKDEYSAHSPTLNLCSYNNKALSQTFF